MKKIILALTVFSVLLATGIVQANNDDNDEISPNIANVLQKDRKQKILIEETGNGNMILIKAATVSAISSVTATSTPNLLKVKVFGQEYKIEVATDTNVVRHYWGKSAIDLSEFSVGDIINAYGTLDSVDPFLIHAKTVRNVSIQKRHTVFTGKILSIASSTNSFTIETDKKTSSVVVNADSNTKIYSGKNLKSFSDLQVNMRVLVRGIWDKTLSKVQALLIRIKPFEVEEDD